MSTEKNKDDMIQKLLDENGLELDNTFEEMAEDADFKAYNVLYETLEQKPVQGLPYAFKSSVMRRIEAEKKLADDTRFYLVFGIASLVGIGLLGTMFYILKDTLLPLLETLNKFKGYIIIIIAVIFLSTMIDQRFAKKQV